MYNVIKHFNDPNHALTLSGHTVERKEHIFLRSHEQAYPVLPTSMHFVYLDPNASSRRGSTILCTCGATAGVFGYEAYKRWTSYIGPEVISCTSFLQYGVHADGSHE